MPGVKERPPRIRGLRASCPATSRTGSGFADGTPVCRHRTGRRPAGPPAGCSSTRPPRLRGPIERASCAPRKAFALNLRSLFLLRAGRARFALNGSPCGHAEERSRQPGIGKLSEHRDVRVVCRPVGGEHRRAPDGQESGRRGRWGGLLFGYFLLATQEKVTRSPQASESSAFRPVRAQEQNRA